MHQKIILPQRRLWNMPAPRRHCFCLMMCLLGLLACDSQPEGCGGNQSAAACISIEAIEPRDEPTGVTSNVDAIQDICSIAANGRVIFEEFTDHNAEITLRNTLAPGIQQGLAVTLQRFSLTYSLNRCPAQARVCPRLAGFSGPGGRTVTIPPNSTVTFTLPFVPLAVKGEYVDAGGAVDIFSTSYTATYMLVLRTQFTDDDITLTGAAEFSITNFDACPRN